jgi:hypothetical protein
MEQSIQDIIINVAYDDVNKPNLDKYDFYPSWLVDLKDIKEKYLVWTQIDKFLGNQLYNFNKNSLDYFNNDDKSFIYPIMLYSNHIFEKYETIDLNVNLLKCIKEKRAKIVFFYLTEGWFGENESHFIWLDNIVEKYDLNVEDLIIITSNLNACENYKRNKFKIITYNYFGDELDFASIVKKDKSNLLMSKKKYLNHINNFNIKKHFLCFNNQPKLHRLWMFYEFISNEKLKNKSILSLSNQHEKDIFYNMVKSTNNIELINFFKNFDSTIGYSYDTKNWKKDVQVGNTINIEAHLNTFINVVTETLTDENIIFITEKTYKPIYMCQPFIIVGNAHSIKKLKELGFKTFDKWWDESYDEETDLNIRLKRIIKLLEEISTWDLDKCNIIREEMKEVFIHNYNKMLSNNEQYKIYSSLQTESKIIKKTII